MGKKVRFSSQENAKGFADRIGSTVEPAANNRFTVKLPRKPRSTRNENIIQPAIRPSGTDGPEWDHYAWTADDL